MIPKQLLETLNLTDAKDIKTAQSLWNMLDSMADTNPQDYQKFVSKNLKEGFNDIKQDRMKREEPLKILPNVGFLLQMRGVLKEVESDKGSDMFKVGTKKQGWEKVRSKFKKELEVYLNVCYSDRVLLPLDKDDNQVLELSAASISKIVSIPYSLQSPSLQDSTVYYLLVLNSQVFNGLRKMNLPYLINMVCNLLQERMNTDRNPLLSLYNPRQYPDRKVFYEIKSESIQMRKDVSYKFEGATKPQKVLLEPGADKEQSLDVNKGKSKEQIKFKQTEPEDIQLPNIKFQTPASQSSKAAKNQSSGSHPKKPLIEQISSNTEVDNKIPYTLIKGQKQYKLEFLVPGISSMKELELDVNTRCIKVNSPTLNKSREVELDRGINVEYVRAKYSKKEHKLNVTLPFI